jgi:hypothetical protein
MPSYTSQDLTIIKQQVVLVYTAGGSFISTMPDAPLLAGFKEAIDQAPQQLVFTLPRRFDNFDEAGAGGLGTIAAGNVVQFWLYGPGLPALGLLRYQGYIDKYAPKIDEQGAESLEVTLTPFGATLGDTGIITTLQMGSLAATTSSTAVASTGSHTITVASATNLVQGAYVPIDSGASLEYVTITTLAGTSLTATFAKTHSGTYNVGGSMDPVAMFNYWFNATNPYTSNPYTYPLTLNVGGSLASSNATPTWYIWQNQTVLSIWQTIMVMLATDTPNWYFKVNANKTVTINKTPTTAQHVLAIGSDFASLSYTKDFTGIKNVIVRVGATAAIFSTATGSDLATYGQRTDLASDVRLTTNAQCNVLAQGTLAIEDQIQYRGQYTAIDYRGDSMLGLGYDIESIAVGDSIEILNLSLPASSTTGGIWDTSKWDQATWGSSTAYSTQGTVVQIVGLSYNFDTIVLELSIFAPSVSRSLSLLAQAIQDFTIIPNV